MALTKVKSGVRTLGTGEVATANMAVDPTNASNLASGTVPTARLGSGSASSGTFLRGDGSWNTAGVSTLAALTDATISASDPAGDSNPSAVGHLWINSTSGEAYIATRVTTDDNYWTNIGSGSGNIAPLEDIIDYLVVAGVVVQVMVTVLVWVAHLLVVVLVGIGQAGIMKRLVAVVHLKQVLRV